MPLDDAIAALGAAFAKPYDGWTDIRSGIHPTPIPLLGNEKLWVALAQRSKHALKKGVKQYAPVIGGRRRYHHRPLTSWQLSNGRTLTLTTDEMEAKLWNNLKRKRHPALPIIYEVFTLHTGKRAAKGKKQPKPKLWAIVHERLTWPLDKDWELFIDSFFRWRAWQKDALKAATPRDLEDFLRFVIDPEASDPLTKTRKRIEHVLPWQQTKERRKDFASRRKQLMRMGGLEAMIKWAKAALKFFHANKVKFRDFDPSNAARAAKGDRTVITNVAESRSKPARTGRITTLR